MKICPKCAFANRDGFPTCVFCNQLLVDVPSVPWPDPGHPEHEQEAVRKERSAIMARQVRFAVVLYALSIMLTSALPGIVSDPPVVHPLILACFFTSGILVALAVQRRLAGQFLASFLQGALSLWLFFRFEYLHPMIFFVLVGQIIFSTLLSFWLDLIHDVNR